MHVDEVGTDVALVRRLLAAQLPDWASLPLERVPSSGTDNALYRLGDAMVVRLPRTDGAVAGLERELEWLPRLAPLLPVAVPAPLATGVAGDGYPWQWAVYRWLDGEIPRTGYADDQHALANDLAQFIRALRRIELVGPPSRRGPAVAKRDGQTRAALTQLSGLIDVDAATDAWEAALRAAAWNGAPVWVHGDLLTGNLLIGGGRLTAVIDFGLVGVGDPACDLMVAWCVLDSTTREKFRSAVEADDATWARGRGWALYFALNALPYYTHTNPAFAELARHVLREVLADR